MLSGLHDIGLVDVVDVLVVALLYWVLIDWSGRVRAHLALFGMATLGALYAIVLQLELQLTAWILQGFFAGFVVLLVVIFQADLRRLFEQIAVLGLRRRPVQPSTDVVIRLSRVLQQMAELHIGAIVVLPGREPLERHLQGGIPLNALFSEELLRSLFDHGSPGHDGAVLLKGDRVAHFAVHLPLTEDRARLGGRGTRHASAIGLTERCDALCLVVSEERGTVSTAQNGRLQVLDRPGEIVGVVRRHLATLNSPAVRRRLPWSRLRQLALEGGTALILALASWFAFVPGSAVGEATRMVAVVVENLPDGYVLDGVEPKQVEVTLAGPQRELFLATDVDFEIVVDGGLVRLGRRTFSLSADAVAHPPHLRVVDIDPPKVVLAVRETH
ncbi:MAG: diadenylate cyclase [bacterium]|nr:diadenylate cyclase [bacterium]